MDADTSDTIIYIIRVFGRVGFVFLSVNLYRLYNFFATPLLRSRSKWFVRGFSVATVLSFALMLAETVVQSPLLPVISMGFNVLTTYILVLYLSSQLTLMEGKKQSLQYRKYVIAMDEFIEILKHPQK